MLKSVLAGTALVMTGGVASLSAAPFAVLSSRPAHIILVAGGCGPAFHRDPFGVCVPNRRVIFGGPPVVVAPVRLPPPCPRGYHRDPDPARPICYPNF